MQGLLLLLLLLLLCSSCSALVLDVVPGRSRCLQEILSKHDLVKGSYKLLLPPEGIREGERVEFEIRVSC